MWLTLSSCFCDFSVTERFMLSELWAKLTISPLCCFLSALFYHSNEGKKTKIHGFWGSNSDPLYWLGYSPVPKEISASGYQELAQGEDSLHHPLPSSPYVLSTPILLCWGFSSEEETKKELKHSWFLVKRRGTHSPWPVVAPSWLLLSLEEHLCWAYALSLPLSGAVGVAQSKECTLRIGVCISYFTHEREKKKATYRRKDLFRLTVPGCSPSQGDNDIRWPMNARIQLSFSLYCPGPKDRERLCLSSHLSWHNLGMSP